MSTNGNGKSLLTTRQLARMLNVHINTVRRWSDQGTLKSYRIGKRCDRRFSREDIALFLEQTVHKSVQAN
jgi:excisionase family DNA binding protein